MDFPDIHSFNQIYDCIVIGAGIEGSSTAFRSAKLGYKTLLLEQFCLPHSRGSSHGPSRIIRYAHNELYYAEMMPEIYDAWNRLEEESNTKLFQQTGLLLVGKSGNKKVEERIQVLKAVKTPYEELTPQGLHRHFPDATFGPDSIGCIDKMGGVLRADKSLKCFQDQFVAHGGILHDEEKVLEILPGTLVTVVTNKGKYRAKSVAITAGPWSSKLLNPIGLEPPIKVWRVNVCFFKEKSIGTYSKWPVFFDSTDSGFAYGFPSIDYPGYMKMGYHYRWREIDPDERDYKIQGESQVDIEFLKKYVRRHFPGLEAEPAIVETCMYTCTPTEDIIIDRHPVYSNIVYACGFSGQGFKLAPIVGKMLCEMAYGKQTSYDLTPFTLKSLLARSKSKL
ncbi:peroxisomal sarcosine oxidase-like [Amphiura filiformis]|uniref:peroxisomal sarcosine oxidase-like n=1 Tax=Amphiura filiformis TaxID=82378 RepID=UPI003B20C850